MQLRVSTDREELDVAIIHDFLSTQSTWARGISRELVERSIENSLCFGGYLDQSQIAFARVVSDYATFANLLDVFVLPEQRGRGFSKQLIAKVIEHPRLQGLRRFTLHTSNAHGLYGRFGFSRAAKPETYMERYISYPYAALSGN
jgi:GNAT superfamily N-acetyltransferase